VSRELIRRSVDSSLALTVTVAVLASSALPSVLPAEASATPPIGLTATTLSKQTVGGKVFIVADITIEPGGSTGWHTHQGEIYGVVKAGTLTHDIADRCSQDGVFNPGDPITDPTGSDHVHIGRNLGDVPVVLEVTYVDPAGAPTSDSVPNPGCPFS
jgi:quercetin dioxygenase-like cupin family protein